jgi:hypothetical protein
MQWLALMDYENSYALQLTEKKLSHKIVTFVEQAERNTVWAHAHNRAFAYPFHVAELLLRKIV